MKKLIAVMLFMVSSISMATPVCTTGCVSNPTTGGEYMLAGVLLYATYQAFQRHELPTNFQTVTVRRQGQNFTSTTTMTDYLANKDKLTIVK